MTPARPIQIINLLCGYWVDGALTFVAYDRSWTDCAYRSACYLCTLCWDWNFNISSNEAALLKLHTASTGSTLLDNQNYKNWFSCQYFDIVVFCRRYSRWPMGMHPYLNKFRPGRLRSWLNRWQSLTELANWAPVFGSRSAARRKNSRLVLRRYAVNNRFKQTC